MRFIEDEPENVKRARSCDGVPGLTHTFRGAGRPGARWDECIRCGVTRTDQDYQLKIRERA